MQLTEVETSVVCGKSWGSVPPYDLCRPLSVFAYVWR